MTKPTADWELVLSRAKSSEARAERMEDEARRLFDEFIDYKEWAHAVATRVLACGPTLVEQGDVNGLAGLQRALRGLMLHDEDLNAVRRMNCEHRWGADGNLDVKMTCAVCGLVMILSEEMLAELARERLERPARGGCLSDVRRETGRWSVLDREDHVPAPGALVGPVPPHIDAEFEPDEEETPPPPFRFRVTARSAAGGGDIYSTIVPYEPSVINLVMNGHGNDQLTIWGPNGTQRETHDLGRIGGVWTVGFEAIPAPEAQEATTYCIACRAARVDGAACSRCPDRTVVPPHVSQGVYVDVAGRKLFHSDGLKVDWGIRDGRMAGDNAKVSWFGQLVGQLRMGDGIWYGIDANEVNAPDQNSMLETATRIVCSYYAVKLAVEGETLRVSGLPFAVVRHSSSDGIWYFSLDGGLSAPGGYLTRDDACIAAFSAYTGLNQTQLESLT